MKKITMGIRATTETVMNLGQSVVNYDTALYT